MEPQLAAGIGIVLLGVPVGIAAVLLLNMGMQWVATRALSPPTGDDQAQAVRLLRWGITLALLVLLLFCAVRAPELWMRQLLFGMVVGGGFGFFIS